MLYCVPIRMRDLRAGNLSQSHKMPPMDDF
jgi:hypothetical protein